MRESIGTGLAGISALWALYFFGLATINVFRTNANRKEGVRRKHRSAFNIIFSPSELTEAGLIARRKCLTGMVGFWLSFLLGAMGCLLANN